MVKGILLSKALTCMNVLSDKKAIFVYTGKKIIQVRAFESNIPLTQSMAIECT